MKRIIIAITLLTLVTGLKAQQTDTTKKAGRKMSSTDSLLNAMSPEDKHQDVIGAFKATRLILSQTTTTVKRNNLNFLVIHRFGDIGTPTGGGHTLIGLDAVSDVYIGFEYGLSDNLNVDFGRNTIGGLIEFGLKYAVLHQKMDDSSPIAITLFGEYGVRPYGSFTSYAARNSYLGQAIISRKFTSALSLQVSPIYVYSNTAIPDLFGNDKGFFALSGAVRYKFTKHMSLVVDYEHPFSSYRMDHKFPDPLGVGIEVETGGHVFTLNITNSRAVSEINSLSNTQSDYARGQFRLGFTISRMFDFNHHEQWKTSN
ncbi:MAG: hypothetical protein JO080_06280 [Mucilaginibacter sp.]|nr:hypothetical protein [Mucilaginibacter sp.]